MNIKEILKPFVKETKEFIQNWGEEEHNPDDLEFKDTFFIMNCKSGSYFKVNMKNSYWYYEDDGTIVFRINDNTGMK